MQNCVKAFVQKNHLSCTAESRYIDLVSEIGELGKEILKGTEYGQNPFQSSGTTMDEMGDCLFSLFALCCEMKIDAREALNASLQKYQKRMETTGSVGSGR